MLRSYFDLDHAVHGARTFSNEEITELRELVARRLERAHDLVISTVTPISEIAMLTGFADQSHLTRCFKQRFGEPPAHLRRALRPATESLRDD